MTDPIQATEWYPPPAESLSRPTVAASELEEPNAASEAVSERPSKPDGFSTAGVGDVVALDEFTLLVLERSFSLGKGNDVRLYEVDISEATNVLEIESFRRHGLDGIVAARKRLLTPSDLVALKPVQPTTLKERRE